MDYCKGKLPVNGSSASSPLSNETRELLISLMKKNNLPLKRQQELLAVAENKIKYVFSFPRSMTNDTSKKLKMVRAPNIFGDKTGLRMRHAIEKSGAYEREMFRPSYVHSRSPKEKERLQNIMAFGKEFVPCKERMAKNYAKEKPFTIDDQFEEILNEIEEREEFLQDMTDLGLRKEYIADMEFEICHRLKELEVLDKKRAAASEKLQVESD